MVAATSGTYAFSPSLGDLMLHAFSMCGIRRTAITPEHMSDAAMAANLMQVEWSNEEGVNLWTVELVSIPLAQGTDVYTLDASTTMVMSAYVETPGPPPIDRIILSVSRDEYAAYPDKTTQGPPTVYWFQRLNPPTVTLWQPPDGNGPYTLKLYRAHQPQDAVLPAGVLPDAPYRFLDAYVKGWALRIAELYAPTQMPRLKMSANEAWEKASTKDVEDVPMRFIPTYGSPYGWWY